MVGDPPTVLIVDDEEDVVEIYALALRDQYDVREAYDGGEALEKADEAVDVAILDRRMPGLSGHEVLQEIRGRGLDIRVAMVTAVDPGFDIVDMDFDAYLTKPVSDDDLRTVVEELLTLSKYDDRTKELFAVAEKKAVLEAEKPQQELADHEEYQKLAERAAELDDEVSGALSEIDGEAVGKVLSGFSDSRQGETGQ